MSQSRDEDLPLPPGYVLERRLGVGSFGSVVTVARTQHLLKVAVKTIDKRRWRADDASGGLYAIKQEAQALKELSGHPNVIDFIDAIETDDCYHLITQHNTGGDLYEHLYETTYVFTDDDLMSDDEWGDDDRTGAPRSRRTLFLNERETNAAVLSATDAPVDYNSAAREGPPPDPAAVRQRERQGVLRPGDATASITVDSPRGATALLLGQPRSPRRVLEMKEYGGRLSEQEAQPLFRQLVRALQYCHAHGIAHRDLKPENVFLDDNQSVLLADFGLCVHFAPDQRRFVPCCGSLLYAAPEIIKQQPYVGPEIDVWGLGILLYEMLCGCTPFKADTDEATRQRILSGTVAFPDHVSAHARALISGMLQVDPALRFDLAAIKKHPWSLYAPLPSASSLLSPRGLVSPRLLAHHNRAASSSSFSTAAKPFSLNLTSLAPSSGTIPSPRYDTTSPRRMALPRPLLNTDNADSLISIPGGADFEPSMPVVARPRSSSSSASPRGPTGPVPLRPRPALWHSPQLCSPDPSPRGPAGSGVGGGPTVSPRSFLSTPLLSPRSRLSPGSPRESAAASRVYYSLMTIEEERKLRLSTTRNATRGGKNENEKEREEESESDEESDESESEREDDDGKTRENERDATEGGAKNSIRERLNIGRINLSLVSTPTPTPAAVNVNEHAGKDSTASGGPSAVGDKTTSAEKHVQENSRGKSAKKGSARKHYSERDKDPRAPIYSAQSPLESPRNVEGRSRSSSFGTSRDRVAVVDFVSSMPRGKQEEKH